MPKISIVTPVYRVEPYLARYITSVMAQTHGDFELILVDDCSPDASGAVCDSFAAKDARIRVIHKAENGGAAAARATGIAAATGEYIGFMDSDDWCEPDMYARLLSLITESGADMAECGYFVSTDERDVPATRGARVSLFEGEAVYEHIHSLGAMHEVLWNKLVRRELVPAVCVGNGTVIGEDYALLLRILSGCRKLSYLPTPLHHYYQRPDSICKTGFCDKYAVALDNWRACREELCETHPAVAPTVTAKLLYNEMSVLVAMTRNGVYDKNIMKTVARDVRGNFFLALRGRHKTFTAVCSLLLTAISPRLLQWVYRLVNKI